MTGVVPNPTFIFRITHLDNLAGILQLGGLFAPNNQPPNAPVYHPIHHASIQNQRAATPVVCGPMGNVHDYVPFYFAPRSPMLCSLQRGNVEGYNGGPAPIIYLVTTIQNVVGAGLRYVFTDGHGIMQFTSYYDDLVHLNEIDWPLMEARYWADTQEDNDRSRRRQAEFLIHASCPWSVILCIGVYNQPTKTRVESLLQASGIGHVPPVEVRPNWYY
ncbi:DUF4433 domain-containing protein [bacterium]|nr:MAG: DUF4433 domain-containing protein [bacterium]